MTVEERHWWDGKGVGEGRVHGCHGLFVSFSIFGPVVGILSSLERRAGWGLVTGFGC